MAPEFEEGVMDIFARKKNLRVMRIANMERLQEFVGKTFVDLKSLVDGGIIVQWSLRAGHARQGGPGARRGDYKGKHYRVNRAPTAKEVEDLLFGWLVEAGVTSNSVIYVKDGVTVGIGTGEQDRVGVAEIARDKAYRKLADRYCLRDLRHRVQRPDQERRQKAEIDAGVAREGRADRCGHGVRRLLPVPGRGGRGDPGGDRSVIQPGGSESDYEVIEACNEADVAMVFTGQRCFKH